MPRDDFYASPFGATYSTYMERPRLARLVSSVVWGADVRPYYESMGALGEVPPGGTVVDCPCGAGPALRALRPPQEVRYVGVDLSPSMLSRARRRAWARGLSGIELLRADACQVPLPDDSADLFLSYWGLHCFSDPASALRETARVLKPGGRLVGSAFVRGNETLRQRLLVRPGTGDFGNPGTEEEVREWLDAADFAAPAVRRSGPMMFFDTQLR
jgi:ubiquinone/menaquinone biosynthesis C-methylase UbiE